MIPSLTADECRKALHNFQHPAQKNYYAFYSSILGGITTDPQFMSVPVDDHVVHRGDGVFEALKCRQNKVYLWSAHKARLHISAAGLGLKVPENLEEIIAATVTAGGHNDCIIRIFLTRGPGQFSPNPYDSVGPQLYVVSTKWSPYPEEKYRTGANLGRSQVPAKEPWLARLKTCNYLPNVMMKKEAVDQNLDFTIGVGEGGFLTEGPTENLILLDKKTSCCGRLITKY